LCFVHADPANNPSRRVDIKGLVAQALQSAVGWSFLSAGLKAGAGLVILPLMARHVPAAHLGLWYVMVSVGALAGLIDFGITPTLARASAYAWAGAERLLSLGIAPAPAGDAAATKPNYALLADLIATVRVYYLALAAVIGAVLLTGGSFWIWRETSGLPEAGWLRSAWLAYAGSVIFNAAVSLWPSLLLGVNGVRQSQQIAVTAQLAGFSVMLAGLLLNWGLWALVAGSFTNGLLTRGLARLCFRRIAGPGLAGQRSNFRWKLMGALWPTAWRTGLVGLGAFLVLQANTLVCSAYLGLETTGSYGLTLQLATLLTTFSAQWVQVKIPLITQWRARGQNGDIALLFVRRIRLVLLTYLVGAALAATTAPGVLQWIGSRTTLLPLATLVTLLLIQFLELHHSCYAWLVMTENVNPFVKPSLISGALIVVASLLLTPRWEVWGMLLSVGVVQAAFNNWWPVLRAVRGLGECRARYWRLFFGLPAST
jgi:O-antigen/teichoic acid export membrane protein